MEKEILFVSLLKIKPQNSLHDKSLVLKVKKSPVLITEDRHCFEQMYLNKENSGIADIWPW